MISNLTLFSTPLRTFFWKILAAGRMGQCSSQNIARIDNQASQPSAPVPKQANALSPSAPTSSNGPTAMFSTLSTTQQTHPSMSQPTISSINIVPLVFPNTGPLFPPSQQNQGPNASPMTHLNEPQPLCDGANLPLNVDDPQQIATQSPSFQHYFVNLLPLLPLYLQLRGNAFLSESGSSSATFNQRCNQFELQQQQQYVKQHDAESGIAESGGFPESIPHPDLTSLQSSEHANNPSDHTSHPHALNFPAANHTNTHPIPISNRPPFIPPYQSHPHLQPLQFNNLCHTSPPPLIPIENFSIIDDFHNDDDSSEMILSSASYHVESITPKSTKKALPKSPHSFNHLGNLDSFPPTATSTPLLPSSPLRSPPEKNNHSDPDDFTNH